MNKSQKIKDALEAKKRRLSAQTIVINDTWSIVRIDDLNWQIKQKGKKQPWDRWYYGTVRGALYGVFDKALNEQPHKWLGSLPELADRIQGCLTRLET